MVTSSQASTKLHPKTTPAMRQYLETKEKYSDTIIFFRMGDFYEMFYEDALTASRVLELTLTSRSKDSSGSPIPMCGIPHHAADNYITRLVTRGFRVALCEQVETAKETKKIIRREVTRIVSPGTLTDSGYLNDKAQAFLMALAIYSQTASKTKPSTQDSYGLALIDLSTGDFIASEYYGNSGKQSIVDEISVIQPREIIISNELDLSTRLPKTAGIQIPITKVESSMFEINQSNKVLCNQLKTVSLDGVGLSEHKAATMASGALINYLQETQKVTLEHVRQITFRTRSDYVVLDPATFKHLEITEATTGGRAGSLIDEIDRTTTAMGSRLLRSWLQRPIHSLESIQDRLDSVEELAFRNTERIKLQDALKAMHDLERLTARVVLGTAGPRELVSLSQSLKIIPRCRILLSEFRAPLIQTFLAKIDDLADIRKTIDETLVENPPPLAREGGAIQDGVSQELDALRSISRNAKEHIAAIEVAERERTGINSLKVRYNKVFGYYIEVTKSNLHAVPDDYQRKQTISTGERYITPTLKDYERQALNSEQQSLEMEQELFDVLRHAIAGEAPRVQQSARALAGIDVLAAFAETASVLNYTKPQIHNGDELQILEGRHPIVERNCSDQFVPNDVLLNSSSQQLVILTGPNMGGKSTYLRQVAIIVLLAHIGSFVPARHAKVPIVDRIFARVGGSDNISQGQSTFMLEMQETAKILNTATSKSLVLLDEIGRGTATFDGLSIAWAVAEYLATNDRTQPKTLFATHYHELTDLANSIPGIVNYHVVAREWKDDIIFLRKVKPGRSDRSYGIQVARLAGLPSSTIQRAKEILYGLENDELSRGGNPTFSTQSTKHDIQPGLFRLPPTNHRHLIEQLQSIDINQLTPIAALTLLAKLKKETEDSE